MIIDTKNVLEEIKKSPIANGIVADLLGKLSFSKDEKKLSIEEREQLGDLVGWLFTLDAEEQVLQLGKVLLQITPESDQDRWSPIDLGLSMPWVLAQKRGDADMVAKFEAKMAEAKAKRNPALKFVFDKVDVRQMNGEHLHDDEIAKAQTAQKTWMAVHAWIRQLKRLCWILARGGSEKMPKPLLEEKISECRDFLRAHTDIAFADFYQV